MTPSGSACAVFVGLIGLSTVFSRRSSPRHPPQRPSWTSPARPLLRWFGLSGTIVVAEGKETHKRLFGTGDALVIRGGTAQGCAWATSISVRRVVADRYSEPLKGVFPISVHTTGTVQILEAQADASVAIIIHACDGVIEGDYLEKFEMPKMSSNETGTTADFARPAHLILGDDRRQIALAGAVHGAGPRQRPRRQARPEATIFRTTLKGAGPVATIGAATVHRAGADLGREDRELGRRDLRRRSRRDSPLTLIEWRGPLRPAPCPRGARRRWRHWPATSRPSRT